MTFEELRERMRGRKFDPTPYLASGSDWTLAIGAKKFFLLMPYNLMLLGAVVVSREGTMQYLLWLEVRRRKQYLCFDGTVQLESKYDRNPIITDEDELSGIYDRFWERILTSGPNIG